MAITNVSVMEKELILKKIKVAEKQAEERLEAAKIEAAKILTDAKIEASHIVESAENDGRSPSLGIRS